MATSVFLSPMLLLVIFPVRNISRTLAETPRVQLVMFLTSELNSQFLQDHQETFIPLNRKIISVPHHCGE